MCVFMYFGVALSRKKMPFELCMLCMLCAYVYVLFARVFGKELRETNGSNGRK